MTGDDVLNVGGEYAEVAVLGAVLRTNGAAFEELALTGADFADARHGELFDFMRSMHSRGEAVDPVTVVSALGRAGDLERVGKGLGFVMGLPDQVPTAANVTYYADIVHDAGTRRRVVAAGTSVIEMTRGSQSLEMLRDQARTAIDRAFGTVERKVRFMAQTLPQTFAAMDEDPVETPTPWRAVNSIIGGLRPAKLYVLGARPSIGKTAIALQMAMELAARGTVAFCSMEMAQGELHLRAIAQTSEISLSTLTHPKALPSEQQKVLRGRVNLWLEQHRRQIHNLAFNDTSGMTVFDVRSFARSVHRTRPLAGVVVDYLQLMTDPRDIPRQEKVAEMSRQLKILSRELDVPVLALSQLNREPARGDKMPQMSDLRESGAIEQDADVVMLLHRDTEPRKQVSDELSLLVAKNRQGETRLARLRWEGMFVRAVDRDEDRRGAERDARRRSQIEGMEEPGE